MKAKKIIAALLAAAMMVTSIQLPAVQVYADETGEEITVQAEGERLDAKAVCGGTEAAIYFNAVDGATGYKIYASGDEIASITDTEYRDDKYTDGRTYQVSAVNGEGEIVKEDAEMFVGFVSKIDDRDERIRYSGNWGEWDDPELYEGTETYSGLTGSKIKFYFYGNKINIIGNKNYWTHSFTLYVDDSLIGTFNTNSNDYGTSIKHQILASVSNLENKIHKVEMETCGNDAAKVSVDAFEFDIAVEDKTLLKTAIDEAKAIVNAENAYKYSDELLENLRDAIKEAEEKCELESVSKNELDAAANAIRTAIDNLKLKTEIRKFNPAILAKNATANSYTVVDNPETSTRQEGPAAWAFDEKEHIWHSNYSGSYSATNVNGQLKDGNQIYIQTGFDEKRYVSRIEYTGRGRNLIKTYEISVANLEGQERDVENSDFKVVKTGTLETAQNNLTISLDRPTPATHVRITVKEAFEYGGEYYVAAKNIAIWGCDEDPLKGKDHWTFEGNGDEQYKSAGVDGTIGVLKGGATIESTGNSVFGNALKLDSSDDYMLIKGETGYLNVADTPVSFSMWYKYTGSGKNANGYITQTNVLLEQSNSESGGTNGQTLLTIFKGKGQYESWIDGGSKTANTSIVQGEWQHVTVVFDGSNMYFYANGEPDGTVAYNNNNVPNESFYLFLGTHKNSGAYFHGYIDEFYVFEKALTAEEVKAIYNEKGLPYEEKLAEYAAKREELASAIANADALYDETTNGTNPNKPTRAMDAAHVNAFEAVKAAAVAGKAVSEKATIEEINTAIENINDAINALSAIYLNTSEVNLVGAEVALGGMIDLKFIMSLGDAKSLADAGAYVQFKMDGKDYSKVDVRDVISAEGNSSTNNYIFPCGIPVKDMKNTITAQLILPGATEKRGLVYTYTVQKYLNELSTNTGTYVQGEAKIEATKTLVSRMGAYGDLATAYFDKVDHGIKDAEMLEAIGNITRDSLVDYEPDKNAIPEKDIYYGSSLLLKSDTELRHYFNEKVEVVSVAVIETVDGEEVETNVAEDAGRYAIEQKKDTELWFLEYTGIGAHELGKTIKVKVQTTDSKDSDGNPILIEIVYSPLTYAYTALLQEGKGVDKKLADLMRIMYLYHEAAVSYETLK